MEAQFNEIAQKEGIKDYLFVGVKEDGSIIAHHPESPVMAYGLLGVAKKLIDDSYDSSPGEPEPMKSLN